MTTVSQVVPPETLSYALQQARCLIWYADDYEASEEEQPLDSNLSNTWNIAILNEAAAQCWLPIARRPGNSFVEDLYLARSPSAQAQGNAMFAEAFQTKSRRCDREFSMTLADGSQIWIHEDVQLEEVSPHHWRLVGVFTDVTTQKLSEERLLHLAHHDSLTQLPNRNYFFHLMTSTSPLDVRYLLYLDLDNFKVINDTLGHPVGDFVLVQVANRLRSCVQNQGDVIRLGGDEFTILLRPGVTEQEAKRLAETLLRQVRAPLLAEGYPLHLSTSIGIASTADLDAPGLLRNADIAMYAAKNQGKNRVAFFDVSMEQAIRSRFELEGELRKALEQGDISLVYQPIVRLDSRELIGVEGLARWHHPTLGTIPPDRFIPIAEETGLIVPLGWRLMEQACRDAQRWRQRHPELGMGLNVSVAQLQEQTFAERVMLLLAETGLPPEKVILEVTESILAEGRDQVLLQLQLLYDAGVGLVMDDFGTGFSSLSALSELPLHGLKVDRAFLQRATDSVPARAGRNQALIHAIASAARALDLLVVAEGIETEEQAILARALGCHLGQGYYFQRPMTAEALELYLGERSSVSVSDLRDLPGLRLAA